MTASAATAGVIGMFFTAGLSGLLSAAAIAACRIALHEAIDYAIDEITSVVTTKIEAKILAEIGKVFTGHLDAGDESDLARYTAGSAVMAQDLVIEFDEFDRASSGYKDTRDNFDKKKGAHKTGSDKRRSSVKKDSRFHKLAEVMDNAEDTVDKKVDETIDVLEKHGGKIDKSRDEHKQNDKDRKKDLDQCKVGDGDDTPMYLLNADGSVERLHSGGATEKLDTSDRMRLDGIVDGQDKTWVPKTPKEKAEWYADSEHKSKVSSRKTDPYANDLGQATQAARMARDDYKGTNYAARTLNARDGLITISDQISR